MKLNQPLRIAIRRHRRAALMTALCVGTSGWTALGLVSASEVLDATVMGETVVRTADAKSNPYMTPVRTNSKLTENRAVTPPEIPTPRRIRRLPRVWTPTESVAEATKPLSCEPPAREACSQHDIARQRVSPFGNTRQLSQQSPQQSPQTARTTQPIFSPTGYRELAELPTESAPLPALPDERLIQTAARRRAIEQQTQPPSQVQVSSQWLQSVTMDSCSSRALTLLDDAYREYSVAAWASAEDSAWKALDIIATGVDVADRKTAATDDTPTATLDLQVARTAIHEARHFLAGGAAISPEYLQGIASSHQTPVFSQGVATGTTASEAADRYFDYARTKLAPLAAYQVRAAQAMDLIAAIHLGRNETRSMPVETALCLRRAALQGQPGNASLASRLGMQLADMGLDKEAELTLNHAMSIAPSSNVAQSLAQVMTRRGDREAALRLTASLRQAMPQQEQPNRIPDVIELSPAQFASISPAVSGSSRSKTSASMVGFRQSSPRQAATETQPVTSTYDQIYGSSQTVGDSGQVSDNRPVGQATTQAGTTLDSRPPSAMKQFLGKLPKLW